MDDTDKVGTPQLAGETKRGEGIGRPDQFTTDELFHGANEILITHRDALYRLKITRQGKLVLNK